MSSQRGRTITSFGQLFAGLSEGTFALTILAEGTVTGPENVGEVVSPDVEGTVVIGPADEGTLEE